MLRKKRFCQVRFQTACHEHAREFGTLEDALTFRNSLDERFPAKIIDSKTGEEIFAVQKNNPKITDDDYLGDDSSVCLSVGNLDVTVGDLSTLVEIVQAAHTGVYVRDDKEVMPSWCHCHGEYTEEVAERYRNFFNGHRIYKAEPANPCGNAFMEDEQLLTAAQQSLFQIKEVEFGRL